MADGRERTRHRRDAMRKCGRAKRGLPDRAAVQLKPDVTDKRPVVRRREFHEQVVRMLTIVNRFSLARLTARQHIGVSAAANRPGLDA